jgi:hypothetical protein
MLRRGRRGTWKQHRRMAVLSPDVCSSPFLGGSSDNNKPVENHDGRVQIAVLCRAHHHPKGRVILLLNMGGDNN